LRAIDPVGLGPVQSQPGRVCVAPIPCDTGRQRALIERRCALRGARPNERQPGVVDEPSGGERDAIILGTASILGFIRMPEGQVDIIEMDPIKPARVTDLDALEEISVVEDIKAGICRIGIRIGKAAYSVEVRTERQPGSDPQPWVRRVDRRVGVEREVLERPCRG
jgi:hypothetical protein